MSWWQIWIINKLCNYKSTISTEKIVQFSFCRENNLSLMDFLLLLLGWEPHTLSLQFLTRWKMRTIKNLTSDPCVLTLWDMALTGSLANLYTTEYSLYSDEIFSLSSLVLTHMRLSKQTFKSTIDNFIWLAFLFSFWLVLDRSVLWPLALLGH